MMLDDAAAAMDVPHPAVVVLPDPPDRLETSVIGLPAAAKVAKGAGRVRTLQRRR